MSSESKPEPEKLHIELSRVQTWLFAVPRLRAMIGANALLGETLRVDLPKLAKKSEKGWSLANDKTREGYPGDDPNDPLGTDDNPAADAQAGIFSRDGGHFEAQFTNGASKFADEAAQLLRTSLPGLRFLIAIDRVPRPKDQVHLSTELPVLAPCQWTGRGVASTIIEPGNDEHPAVSLDVEARHKAATRTKGRNPTAKDVASLLANTTKLRELRRPKELENLVGGGYLAVIHADGNGVGSGAGTGDRERARFFHRNRVLLRRSVQKAIDTYCQAEYCRTEGLAPLIPLMLGGDDLLLVCRAEIALPFVVTLCEELAALQTDNNDFKLTLGVGAVIAKHTIPIHRLHEVAEQLASSAKRRYRGFKKDEQKRSVVDWAVYSTSWVDNPAEVRRRDWLRGTDKDLRVLSQRPVDVLGVLGTELNTLQGLVRGAEKLVPKAGKFVPGAEQLKAAPRSQLRYLVDQLPRGRALSELAFAELSKEAKGPLGDIGVREPWARTQDNTALVTPLLDLVEITEIAQLGRHSKHEDAEREDAETEATHG